MKNKSLNFVSIVLCLTTYLNSAQAVLGVLDTFYPEIQSYPHVWLNADILCLRPKEKSIVLTNNMTNLFINADITQQPALNPNFKYDVGCRVGFGYLFSNKKWDMALNWLHFNSNLKQRASTNQNIALGMFPIWSLACDIIPYDWVSQATMCWKLDVNLLDLDFGRAFCWRERFFLRPFIGLRSAWINQDLNVAYGGGIFANGLNVLELGSTFGDDSMIMKNNFWGIGPRLGIEPHVNLGNGFRLYASACGTMAASLFNVCQKETYLETIRYLRKCSPHKLRWMLDATAGIMWKTFCRDNRYALTFAFGWEYHLFSKQVELQGDRFCLVSNDRNLSLNGVAFSSRFDF